MKLKYLARLFAALAFFYLIVASAAWQVRNPTANEMTMVTEFRSLVTFKKLAKFQGIE